METVWDLTQTMQTLDFSSYPTYEEWKLEEQNTILKDELKVLILPMRNGN